MKLLIAGSNEVWALEKFYCKYLSEAGVELKLVPVQSIFYEYYYRGLLNKLLYKAGVSGISRTINNEVCQQVESFKPDVMWVFKGMEISPATIKWVRERGVKLVNYNPDNPFVFTGRGSGNKNITHSIGLYHLHLTYDENIRQRIVMEYNIPCQILPFGFDVDDELYHECTLQQEVMKVCFLGNPDPQRAAFLQQIAEAYPVDVYGTGWEKKVNHANIQIHAPVYGADFWKVLYRYRVQLNLMRLHNPASHNMRSFEVPGIGGIGLFTYTPDHEKYFEEGKEIFLFRNVAECCEKIRTLLEMPAASAQAIRLAARKKSIEAAYTYRDRALQALAHIRRLLA
jgi:spore maturation protein CgeB